MCACVCVCERVSESNGGRRRQLYLVLEPKERGGVRPLNVSFVNTWFSYDWSPQTVQFAQFLHRLSDTHFTVYR